MKGAAGACLSACANRPLKQAQNIFEVVLLRGTFCVVELHLVPLQLDTARFHSGLVLLVVPLLELLDAKAQLVVLLAHLGNVDVLDVLAEVDLRRRPLPGAPRGSA